jgi:hypothetical protein
MCTGLCSLPRTRLKHCLHGFSTGLMATQCWFLQCFFPSPSLFSTSSFLRTLAHSALPDLPPADIWGSPTTRSHPFLPISSATIAAAFCACNRCLSAHRILCLAWSDAKWRQDCQNVRRLRLVTCERCNHCIILHWSCGVRCAVADVPSTCSTWRTSPGIDAVWNRIILTAPFPLLPVHLLE